MAAAALVLSAPALAGKKPDLVVSSATPAVAVTPDVAIKVTAKVKNQGNAPTSAPDWKDWVILSQDPTIGQSYVGDPCPVCDGGDRNLNNQPVILGFQNPSYLDVGQSYQQTVQLTLPINFSGPWYVYVVTNGKFAGHFERWAEGRRAKSGGPGITVVNDHSTDDSNKLGAIGDLNLVLTQAAIDDDIVVVAGDNLFSERLGEFGEYARAKGAPVLAVYDVGDLEAIKKYNSIEVDDGGRITFFEEKPANPKSTLTGIALYYYTASALQLIRQYVEEGNNPDQPGRLVQWIYTRTPFYTWRVPGILYDVGSKETLEEANRILSDPSVKG